MFLDVKIESFMVLVEIEKLEILSLFIIGLSFGNVFGNLKLNNRKGRKVKFDFV